MAMRQLNAQEVVNLKIKDMGFDPVNNELGSVEIIAAILRRNASYLCPTTPAQLIHSVIKPLRGLENDSDNLKEVVENTVQAMISYGDLIESKDFMGFEDHKRMMLYAAPCHFIIRGNGNIMLSGIVNCYNSTLPQEIADQIEYFEHLRMIRSTPGSNLKSELMELGYSELSMQKWLRTPKSRSPQQHIAIIGDLLIKSSSSSEIPGLEILDSTKPVTYYKGRWIRPANQTGRFIARRDQTWGSKLWSYVQLNNGKAEHIIDFPVENSTGNARDEAWLLQLAIDASCGNPQQFHIEPKTDDFVEIKLFSPIPTWAQRRLDVMGEPKKLPGCLFGYNVEKSDIKEIVDFLIEHLWLRDNI